MLTKRQEEIIGEKIILLNIKDVEKITGWSEATVRNMFKNDKEFPAIKKGKEYLVEHSALKQYFSQRRTN